MKPSKRLGFIDIARALAMLVIVLSHSLAYSANCYQIYRFLFSFSIPMFFILSGYTFRIKEDEKFIDFLKNKLTRIVLPYIFWGLLFLIPYALFEQQGSSQNIWTQIGNVFYGNGVNSALKQNTPLWFLPALFSTEIIYYFIIKMFNKNIQRIILLPILILVGFLSTLFLKNFYLPFGINSALEIGVFFYIGYLLKNVKLFEKKKKINILYFLSALVIGIIGLVLNGESNVVWADYFYQEYFSMLLSGTFLSVFFIGLATIIDHNKILEYVGKNTMSILIFHRIIVFVFQTKMGPASNLLNNSNILVEFLLAFVVSCVAIAVSIAIKIVIYKIPCRIGKKLI